ncbi:MAG: hypothetical protein ACFB0B_09915 [Thermonemataceae bacterium]
MSIRNIEHLYIVYKEKRSVKLSLEQFTTFAEFFPTLLVIKSDGVIDSGEKLYLQKLSESLGNIFKEDGLGSLKINTLIQTFKEEFEYLLYHLEEWQDAFLEALKGHLENNPHDRETILDTIYLFAETSEDVSDDEKSMLEYIKNRLQLEG